MKDLTDRFAESESRREAKERLDPLARLQEQAQSDPERSRLRQGFDTLRRRPDVMAVVFSLAAATLVLWPLFYPRIVRLPPVAETNTEIATLAVQPLADGSIATAPDWDGLFSAYQLETSLRDISIRCNYGLPMDARVDRYLHARLAAGMPVRIFLADPGTCPTR